VNTGKIKDRTCHLQKKCKRSKKEVFPPTRAKIKNGKESKTGKPPGRSGFVKKGENITASPSKEKKKDKPVKVKGGKNGEGGTEKSKTGSEGGRGKT